MILSLQYLDLQMNTQKGQILKKRNKIYPIYWIAKKFASLIQVMIENGQTIT